MAKEVRNKEGIRKEQTWKLAVVLEVKKNQVQVFGLMISPTSMSP